MLKWMVVLMLFVFIVSCSSKNTGLRPSDVTTSQQRISGERMIWSSSKDRPVWTVLEPNSKDGYLFFVGLSDMHATEKSSREEAMRSAINSVVGYLGVEVRDVFQNIVTRFGLSSDIADPQNTIAEIEKIISDYSTIEENILSFHSIYDYYLPVILIKDYFNNKILLVKDKELQELILNSFTDNKNAIYKIITEKYLPESEILGFKFELNEKDLSPNSLILIEYKNKVISIGINDEF